MTQGTPLAGGRQARAPRASSLGGRIFLLKVGESPLGMLPSETARNDIYFSDHWDQDRLKQIPSIEVAWDIILDSDELLPRDVLLRTIPGGGWSFQGGGVRLAPDVAVNLELLWAIHEPVAQVSEVVEARYTLGVSSRRLHQPAFRRLLLRFYPAECAVCGLAEEEILEAEHIVPDSEGGPSGLDNGRLLCPNHHQALDAGLYRLTEAGPVWNGPSWAF